MEEFDHHSIDEYGNVLNEKTGNILKPYVGSGGYLYVKPCENNITKHLSIYRPCKLYVGNKLIDEFLSITEAVDYAEKHYNVKRAMLHKHLVYKNVRIERCND
jgi:hypothetical protein